MIHWRSQAKSLTSSFILPGKAKVSPWLSGKNLSFISFLRTALKAKLN